MDERDPSKIQVKPDSPPVNLLLPLDHFRDDMLSKIYGNFDVPEMLKILAIVDRRFLTLITKNLDFIHGYNLRDRPPVWLFNHCTPHDQHQRYGVLYAFRMSDGRKLSVGIRPRVNLNGDLTSIRLIDVSGNFSLFRLGPVNSTLLVINPFGPRDYAIDLPDSIFPKNLFEITHHLSITTDVDTFRVLCILFVDNVPVFHLYDSRQPNWVVSNGNLWSGEEAAAPRLASSITMLHNQSLYTMGFRNGDHPNFYIVSNVVGIQSSDDDVDSSWYYFEEWGLLLRSWSYELGAKQYRHAADLNLYRRTSFANSSYVHVCSVPHLQHFRIPVDLNDNITLKVFDGILYIQIQYKGPTSYPYCGHQANHVSQYHIADGRWLPSTIYPFSTIRGGGHASPRFASRLTLPLP